MYIGLQKHDFFMIVLFAFMFAHMYVFVWYQTYKSSDHSKTAKRKLQLR